MLAHTCHYFQDVVNDKMCMIKGGAEVKVALVIDDDHVWRRNIADFFLEHGYKVYQATSAIEGITKAIKYRPDIIVVDYILPKISGTYVVRFLRSNPVFKNAGIVLLSFSDEFINEYWAQEYGADMFLKKEDGLEKTKKRLENFIVVDFKSEKGFSVLTESNTIEGLMEAIDEDLRKEKINRDFLELVGRVDDESYVMRRLWNMFRKFADIKSMFVMLVTPAMGRVYAYSKMLEKVCLNSLKDKLLSLLKKPVTPSDWTWGGNVHPTPEGKSPEISYYKRIVKNNEEIGVIAFGNMEKEEKRKLITLLKDAESSLAVLLRTLNLFWDYKVAADVDSLTGLLVKKVILSKVEEYRKLSSRQGITFSVAMLDIDDFKKVNDTYGHVKGDEVLRKIGQIIASSVRETDIAGRYGGEEFLIIFPGSDEEEAKTAVERILEEIRSYEWEKLGTGRITMSAGVARAKPGKTVTEIIGMADKALYEAKKQGKDRCLAYKEER